MRYKKTDGSKNIETIKATGITSKSKKIININIPAARVPTKYVHIILKKYCFIF